MTMALLMFTPRSPHRRLHTSFVCYRSVWGYNKPYLQARILAAYKAVNLALATGDMRYAEPVSGDGT
jgi:hypothetical protein